LAAYVVMDDHVHALLTPLATYELKGILHSWKSFTSRQMQRRHRRFGRGWQDEYFDRIVHDDRELAEKQKYIIANPWKRGSEMESYLWVRPLERNSKRWREQMKLARYRQAETPVPLTTEG
jgi:Transposase IS200 like